MANIIEETENVMILTIFIALMIGAAWLVFKFRNLFKVSPGDAGAEQSVVNAANGFPQGGDPGTNLIAQTVQGIVESVRNIFYVDDGSPDPGSATEAQQEAVLETWSAPTPDQVQQNLLQGETTVSAAATALQTDPGALLQQWGML